MNKILLALLMLVSFSYGAIVKAQPAVEEKPPIELKSQMEARKITEMDASREAAIKERFNQCMNNPACPIQTRMQIMQDEHAEINRHFDKIHQACVDVNFTSCAEPQDENVKKWHETHSQMLKMMQSMNAMSLEKKAPAAGGGDKAPSSDAKEGKRWDKIWWYKGKK